MKQLFYILYIISALVLILSCTTLKRYSTAHQSVTNNTLAGIDLFGFSISDSKSGYENKTLWDLSADAQSQFIKILNNRFPENEKFLEAMSFEYLKQDPSLFPENYVSKDLRMVFSITRKRNYGNKADQTGVELSPADRIEYLRITLRIPDDSGIRFTGWNMFTTEYGSVDIADVTFSRNLDLDVSGLLSADSKYSAGEITAGGKSSSIRREDQEIKYRYLKLNGKIRNNEIEMEEEGTREIDLTGNITADIFMEFEKFPEMITDFIGLKDSVGRFNEPGRLVARYSEVLIPSMEYVKDTVYAELKMDYVLRNVVKGAKTFQEWDDRVRYYTGSVSKTIPLFTSHDYVPAFFCIGTNRQNAGRDIIKISSPLKKEYSLIFRTSRDASDFYEWMTGYFSGKDQENKAVTIGGYRLRFRDADLTGEAFGRNHEICILPCYW
jgi:hypothetical protein